MFTNDQLKAINHRGGNILVSAGAGSGKTAVLSERVISLLNEGIKINQLLILTFTNAAALEMKERIFKKMQEHENLHDQLELIESSDITTFDAFNLKLIKQYHYYLNISENVVIGDEISFEIEKTKILTRIFETAYRGENPDLLELIDKYSIFDDTNLQKKIISLHSTYQNQLHLPDIETYFLENTLNDQFFKYEQILFNQINEIDDLYSEYDEFVDPCLENFKEKLAGVHTKIKECISYDKLFYLKSTGIKFPGVPRNDFDNKEDFKILHTLYKKKVNLLLENVFNYSKEEAIYKVVETKKYALTLFSIIKQLDEQLMEYKKSISSFDFADITKLSIELLTKNINICEKIKHQFKEILIDEYQDTNDFQDHFINLISNNNTYMVGDVKQSIYGFRNANPKNFANLEKQYNQDNTQGTVINLMKNFRSRSDVLEDVNYIFNNLMTEPFGGVNYDKSQQLTFGNKTFELANGFSTSNFDIITYKKDELKDNFDKLEPRYYEPLLIGFDIIKRINQEEQVLNLKTQQLENLNYGHIAILTRSKTSYDDYVEVFEHLGIIIDSQKEAIFKRNDDTLFFKSIFKIITTKMYNQEEKLTNEFCLNLISILRSFIIELDDEKIYNFILNQQTCNEINLVLSKIINLKTLKDNSLTELFDTIIDQFSVFKYISKLTAPMEVTKRIMHIRQMCVQFDQEGKKLSELNEYFEYMFINELDVKLDMPNTSTNAVKLMTIHKSKGLEFPVVYLPSLTSKIKQNNNDMDMYLTSEEGLILPFITDYIKEKTFLYKLHEYSETQDAISETIRLMYVAMTRAKEKIIFVTNSDFERIKNQHNFKTLNSLLQFHSPDIKKFIKHNLYFNNEEIENFILGKKIINEIPIETIHKKYTHKFIEKPKQKLSTISGSHKIDTILTKKERDNLKLGTKIHAILEHSDLKSLNVSKEENPKIQKILLNMQKQPIFQTYINMYPEFEFKKDEKIGFIDLVLEFDDKFLIVDYKLKDIDKPEYVDQLKFYQDVLISMVDKPVEMLLYSLLDNKFKTIN